MAAELTGSRAVGSSEPGENPLGSGAVQQESPPPIAPTLERPSGPSQPRNPSGVSLLGVGSDLGAYRLQQLLGTGGMGQVYLAEHRKLGRQVAIKLLLPELSEDAEMLRRFFHEARVVNQIRHENIVEISDFVEEVGGLNYLIMEFLDGQNLTQTRRRDGPFKIRRTLAILDQVCSALEGAHSKGVVHRDLKPDNIFLIRRTGRDDFVKLLDFGIAKMTALTGMKTNIGAVLGTPIYMAPEQAEGRTVDGRADLYSLGVLLHWMLFDELPPRAGVKSATLRSIRTTTGTQPEHIPGALLDLLVHCLRFEPEERPPNAQWIRRALLTIDPGIRSNRPGQSSVKRARFRPGLLWAIAASVLAAGTAVAFRTLSPSRPAVPPVASPPTPTPTTTPPPSPAAAATAPPTPTAIPTPNAIPTSKPTPARPTLKRARTAGTSKPAPAIAAPVPAPAPAPEKKPDTPRPDQDGEDGMMNPFGK